MSVTGFMYNINATKKLQEIELEEGYEGNRSWHHQFKDSAYVYIGGLHLNLTEGDVAIVFSQFGEVVDVNLIRDKATGKSKGFAFVCYEDQRSTILATDNMNGFEMLGRTIRVDHVAKYKAPKKLDEENLDADGDATLLEYKATGAEGKGYKVYNELESQRKIADIDKERRAKASERRGDHKEDDDEKWARQFESGLADRAAKDERKAVKKETKKESKEIKKMKKETKKLKKAAKKAKKESKKGKKVKQESSSSSSGSGSGSS